MSPWWSNCTLRLGGMEAARLEPGGGRTVLALTGIDPEAALQAAAELLLPAQRRGLHRVTVLLGQPFAQCFVLPWQPLATPAAWQATARAKLAGSGVPMSRVAMIEAGWGRQRLAVASAETLCAGLAGLCKARKRTLVAIVPTFVHASNEHRRRIRDGNCAVMVLDGRYAQIGFRRERDWQGFMSLPYADGMPLKPLLRDAAALTGQTLPERVYLLSAGRPAPETLHGLPKPDWAAVDWLPPPSEAAA